LKVSYDELTILIFGFIHFELRYDNLPTLTLGLKVFGTTRGKRTHWYFLSSIIFESTLRQFTSSLILFEFNNCWKYTKTNLPLTFLASIISEVRLQEFTPGDFWFQLFSEEYDDNLRLILFGFKNFGTTLR